MKVWTDSIRRVKIALVVTAVAIAVVSLVVSHILVRDLQREEVERMEVWAEAMRSLINADENTDLNLVLKVINGNHSIPLMVVDETGAVTIHRNIPFADFSTEDSIQQVENFLHRMQREGEKMEVKFTAETETGTPKAARLEIWYEDSLLLRRLAWFPFVQLGVVGLFVVIAVFALLSSKRAEQSKVWVGLSKETAHQLGTPISSLMAWTEVLGELYEGDEMIAEMKKDVKRLELIAERFSKIGSVPELKVGNLCEVIDHVVSYIRRRTSDDVVMECRFPEDRRAMLPLCAPLLEWVVEVLCKNAIDAMAGSGSITITVFRSSWQWVVDVKDTGKGIPNKHLKTVFKPGFTTKQRGWGLGLSLAKRIVEEYHGGRIYVKASEMGVGTTFRIELKA
ncbi:MAG: HAMP domain-containing histidine kinase [Bacteroidales bacterium]|nr:HAMP domain-containing histidine kinase [Bacteroidales bacterium]